ncbi:MAG TPA: hypothetical protein VFW63_11065 [Acidimicrobiales bacterium]|nr:hypothetical protein [Acidimicrobiales bacterium]
MPTDDPDDPGASTAMFRAYVDHPAEPGAPARSRAMVIALVAVIVAVAVVALVLAVA